MSINMVSTPSENDVTKIPEEVLKHFSCHKGQRCIVDIDGISHEYLHALEYPRSIHFAKKLQAEMDIVETYICHSPSIGIHYESILRSVISDFIPEHYKVGTGFVIDLSTKISSPQTDIIIYDTKVSGPIYKSSEFCIVDKDQVVACCEVKKNLTSKDLRSWLKKTIRHDWGRRKTNLKFAKDIALFAFTSKLSSKRIHEIVCEEIEIYLGNFKTKNFSGREVTFSMSYMTLPKIILFDRPEYISCNVAKCDNNSSQGKVEVDLLSNFGANGIAALLSYVDPIEREDPSYIDFVSSFVSEVIKTVALPTTFYGELYINNYDLIKLFPDANELLKMPLENNSVVLGAQVNFLIDINSFKTLKELSKTKWFKLKVFDLNKKTDTLLSLNETSLNW